MNACGVGCAGHFHHPAWFFACLKHNLRLNPRVVLLFTFTKRTASMNWRPLWTASQQLVTRAGRSTGETLARTGPGRQITGVAADLLRSRQELIAENAFLRQQIQRFLPGLRATNSPMSIYRYRTTAV